MDFFLVVGDEIHNPLVKRTELILEMEKKEPLKVRTREN